MYSYPWQRSGCCGGRVRAAHHRTLTFGGGAAAAAESKARWASTWRDLWGRAWLRHVLVIINPIGGVRRAVAVYEKVRARAAPSAAAVRSDRGAPRRAGSTVVTAAGAGGFVTHP